MAVNVIAHDRRLEGRAPATNMHSFSIEVSEDTPLDEFFNETAEIADAHGGIDVLYIMCHGLHVIAEDTTALQFCHELISYRNVSEFQRLRGKVDRIVLFACHAAETTMTQSGDGDELCRRIALNAAAEVTAAREVQTYYREEHCSLFFCEETAIEFGDWEGEVVVYGRDGSIISRFGNPSVWYDGDGGMHDPRREARPAVWYDSHRQRHGGR